MIRSHAVSFWREAVAAVTVSLHMICHTSPVVSGRKESASKG